MPWSGRHLARLGHFIHRAQAAGADIDIARHAINRQTAVLNIQHKASVGMTLGVTDIASVLWFTLTDIAASGSHTLSPLYFDYCFPV